MAERPRSTGRSGGRDGDKGRGPRNAEGRGGPRGGSGPRGGPRGRSSQGGNDSRDWVAKRDTVRERSVSKEEYDGPDLPEEITGKELPRAVTAQLRGLPEKLAARVARHLAAAGTLIDTDPETAYKHTLAARARAARIAVVREACGEAAYAAGHFAEALSELRAARRMNGAADYLPVIADCERGLGRPEKALDVARDPAVRKLGPALRVEMTIVEAGARRDLKQTDAALRVLENAPLHSQNRDPWLPRLRYAYAETLLEAGRDEDALTWFHRTEAVDGERATDAYLRVAELERRIKPDFVAPDDTPLED